MNKYLKKRALNHLKILGIVVLGGAGIPLISWAALSYLTVILLMSIFGLWCATEYEKIVDLAVHRAKGQADALKSLERLEELGGKFFADKFPVTLDFILYSISAWILWMTGHPVISAIMLTHMAFDCSRDYLKGVAKGLVKIKMHKRRLLQRA